MTGLRLSSFGITSDGLRSFETGANIWISSIDVVASGPSNLTASDFQYFDDSEGDAVSVVTPIKLKDFKSKEVKLQLSKSRKGEAGVNVAESASSAVTWQPATAGEPLTIRCMRGTYIPAFPLEA
jgi:hypothetical protein